MPSSATHPIPDAPIVAGEEQLAVSEGPISFGAADAKVSEDMLIILKPCCLG